MPTPEMTTEKRAITVVIPSETNLPEVAYTFDIRYILDRYPERQALGWWPIIQVDGNVWDMTIYIVRLPYDMCFVSAHQSRVACLTGPPTGTSYVWSRFAYHRGLNVAIGNARIVGSWVGGWDRTIRWDQLRFMVDPLMAKAFSGLMNVLLRNDIPFHGRIDPNDAYSERRLMDSWGSRLRRAMVVHFWSDFVDFMYVRKVVRLQRR
jgi:hypothetical protein